MQPDKDQEIQAEQPLEEVEVAETEAVDTNAVAEEAVKEDRPERNYAAELERKNRQLAQKEAELEAERCRQVNRRDANDLSTWSDTELKAIKNSNDASTLPYKEQAEEILLERRIRGIREKERMSEKRAHSDLELRTKYPEAMDPASEFSAKVEQVMFDLDLHKSPAGRLAAAKIVAAETNKGRSSVDAKGRKAEADRVASVKANLSEGDRPAGQVQAQSSQKALADLQARAKGGDASAMNELIKQRGLVPKK